MITENYKKFIREEERKWSCRSKKTSSECPDSFANSEELEDAGSSLIEKEFVMALNDAEEISENMLTRSEESYRKSAKSKELEDGYDKEIDIDDVEVNKNLMSKDAENMNQNLVKKKIRKWCYEQVMRSWLVYSPS